MKIGTEIEWDMTVGGVAVGKIVDILRKTKTTNTHLQTSSYLISSPNLDYVMAFSIEGSNIRRRKRRKFCAIVGDGPGYYAGKKTGK